MDGEGFEAEVECLFQFIYVNPIILQTIERENRDRGKEEGKEEDKRL